MPIPRGYTFDDSGALLTAPEFWHVPVMPYRYEWERWTGHVWECAQCAQHNHEKGGGTPYTPPCATGVAILSDFYLTVRQLRAESVWN